MAESSLELHAAVCCNDTEQLQALLESGQFDINEKDIEWGYKTALHWAAQKGYVECAKQLLDFEANGTSRMAYGATPAHCAAEAGRLLILKLFVKSKVSVTQTDEFGDRPIDKARTFDHKQCVDFLKQTENEAIERRKARAQQQKVQRTKMALLPGNKKPGVGLKAGNSKNSVNSSSTTISDDVASPRNSSPVCDNNKSQNNDVFNSDEDIDDDPVPHDDVAYLAWVIANAKEQPRTGSARSHRTSNKGDDTKSDTNSTRSTLKRHSTQLSAATGLLQNAAMAIINKTNNNNNNKRLSIASLSNNNNNTVNNNEITEKKK